jgi:hypothetical protein
MILSDSTVGDTAIKKSLGEGPYQNLKRRWKDTIDLRDTGCENGKWMGLIQDHVKQWISGVESSGLLPFF